MFKKILLFISLSLMIFTSAPNVLAAEEPNEVNLYFFHSIGCPHCKKETYFLQKMEEKYPTLNVYAFEVSKDKNNVALMIKVGGMLDVDVSSVPLTVIGEKPFAGFYNEETSGYDIEKYIQKALKKTYKDPVGELLGLVEPPEEEPEPLNGVEKEIPEKINLPLLGEVEVKSFSLPLLTIIIGALDGFNPCAMWVLIFLISLLLGMENRRRMWALGTTFILASALVYFLFMSAWLNLFMFLGFILWVRLIIALIALFAGGYNLREYFLNKEGVCKVTSNEKRRKIFDKLKEIVCKQRFWLAMGGIIVMAFAVNVVELICSAGLPAVYTQILTLTELPSWQYYLYLLLYIFVFMLDDLIVFIAAMVTLKMTGLNTKYTKYSHLIGGLLMLILGALLILKPEWLMFG